MLWLNNFVTFYLVVVLLMTGALVLLAALSWARLHLQLMQDVGIVIWITIPIGLLGHAQLQRRRMPKPALLPAASSSP